MAKLTLEELADIKKRLQIYYGNLTPDKRVYISGINSETGLIVLKKDDSIININMDDLEKGNFNFDTFSINPVNEEKIEVMEEPIEQLIVDSDLNTGENLNNKMTLNDVKTLVELNNKDTLDKIISTFSKNVDGTPNINGAVVQVTNNSIKEAINSIMENRNFSSELYKYDVTGKIMVPEDVSEKKVSKEDIINNSFNNVLIYTDVAKLYGISYSDTQKQIAKQNYTSKINAALDNLGYNDVVEIQKEPEVEKEKVMTYTPIDNKKAGFADIFILSIIVLVYLAIIINLIMKLR